MWLVHTRAGFVPKSCERCYAVIRHGQMYLSFFVVLIHINSTVLFPVPVFCDDIEFFEYRYEMVGMFFSNVFYSEIVYDEAETDWAQLMCPETW